MDSELLPCPFCEGSAEADTLQMVRDSALLDSGVTVECCSCGASLQRCYSDHPGSGRDDLMADLIDHWNRRAAPPPPAEQASGDGLTLRQIAKRNLRQLIELGSDDKRTMLLCLEELS